MALEYGVSLVAIKTLVDQLLGNLKAHATFQVEAFGLSRRYRIEFTASDVIDLAAQIAAWALGVGKQLNIPPGPEFGIVTLGYTPAYTGAKTVDPVVADQSEFGATVPEYDYIDPPGGWGL